MTAKDMDCVICKSGKMEDGKVTVTLQRGESVIVVKNVPAMVCDNCGEYKVTEAVAGNLLSIAEDAVAKNAEIEVLQYAA